MSKNNILSAIFGGILGAVLLFIPAFYQIMIMNLTLQVQKEQIEIMQQSLEKEVHLIMTVVPSYQISVMTLPNGSVEERHTTLTLSKTGNFTFIIYVSNVGTAFSHILYCSISLSCDSTPKYTVAIIPFIETKVLEPYETTTFDYIFSPTRLIPSDVLSTTHFMNLTFTVGSIETTLNKVVFVQFPE